MVKEDRIKHLFRKLAEFDSESFHERAIGQYLTELLQTMGLEVRTDTTDAAFLREHPDSFPNIYGILKGDEKKPPILFSSHFDTVSPGIGKRVKCSEAGILTSAGDTVLGADDISGMVAILEALFVIQEHHLEHGDIEVLFSPAEEAFCEGTRYMDDSLIGSDMAYVLDLSGRVGTAAVAAPSILSFDVEIIGRAAHAGFAPETGINALTIAVDALKDIPTGRIDPETTVNVGTISGGTGKNIVPERIRITGEVRSHHHLRARTVVDEILESFRIKAGKAGGKAIINSTEHLRAFEVAEAEPVVQRFLAAAKAQHIDAALLKTFGGSDGNRLNETGIKTIVVACAMEQVHTVNEYTDINELKKAAELTLRLMTME